MLFFLLAGVSFTPREAGEHFITVKRDGNIIPKSPFRIKVDKSQVNFLVLHYVN